MASIVFTILAVFALCAAGAQAQGYSVTASGVSVGASSATEYTISGKVQVVANAAASIHVAGDLGVFVSYFVLGTMDPPTSVPVVCPVGTPQSLDMAAGSTLECTFAIVVPKNAGNGLSGGTGHLSAIVQGVDGSFVESNVVDTAAPAPIGPPPATDPSTVFASVLGLRTSGSVVSGIARIVNNAVAAKAYFNTVQVTFVSMSGARLTVPADCTGGDSADAYGFYALAPGASRNCRFTFTSASQNKAFVQAKFTLSGGATKQSIASKAY